MFLFFCENHVLLVLLFEHSDVDAWFIERTSKTYTYVLNLKKILFYFSNKEVFGECTYETGGVQYLEQS